MSEEEEQRQRDKQKFRYKVAQYRAMPLRSITKLDAHLGRECEGIKEPQENLGEFSTNNSPENSSMATAVLDCGHRKVLPEGLMGLRVGDSVRCPECYEDGMKSAERMVPKLSK